MEAIHKFYNFFAMSFIATCVVKVCVALRLISEEDSWPVSVLCARLPQSRRQPVLQQTLGVQDGLV